MTLSTAELGGAARSALAALDARARKDLRTFCATYLQHHFRFDEDEKAEAARFGMTEGWGRPQIALADALTALVSGQIVDDNLVVEMSRGFGKSTIGVVGFLCWLACTRGRKFVMLISDSHSQAEDHLAAVLDELENNEKLRRAFGALYVSERSGEKAERKRQDDVTFTNGVRLIARGAGNRIRGAKWKNQRPDLVVMDDPQGEAEAESADMMAKRLRWMDRVVKFIGKVNCKFVLIATPIRADDAITHMARKPGTKHLRYPGINADGTPADPHRFPAARLAHLLEQTDPQTFAQEILLKAAGAEQRELRPEWLRWVPVRPAIEDGPAFIGVDPKAKKEQSGDNFCAAVGRRVGGCLVIERVAVARCSMHDQVAIVVMLAQAHNARVICVEAIAAQEWFEQELIKQLREAGHAARIIKQVHGKKKEVYLTSVLQRPLYMGQIAAVDNAECRELEKEMEGFPDGAHDDRIDALADLWIAYAQSTAGAETLERMERLNKYVAAQDRVRPAA